MKVAEETTDWVECVDSNLNCLDQNIVGYQVPATEIKF